LTIDDGKVDITGHVSDARNHPNSTIGETPSNGMMLVMTNAWLLGWCMTAFDLPRQMSIYSNERWMNHIVDDYLRGNVG
jgi:hypothetical protein